MKLTREVVKITCESGHQVRTYASVHVPVEKRLVRCPVCDVAMIVPLVSDETKRIK